MTPWDVACHINHMNYHLSQYQGENVATKTPEQKMADIFQEVGLQRFQQMTKLIVALNTPKKTRKVREKIAAA